MRFKILAILIFLFSQIFSQTYDKNYFRSPVNIPVRLAGNFGEIRSNHFHSGIDIKVPFVGAKLYAAADGYVSRIRKSAGGYGNALYITHPNGLRTVYGHMQKFTDEIEKYTEQYQYKQKKFEVTIYPDTGKFKVKKGDLIGYAGNSGYSYGPHLHFEIREAENDIPLNPELFNFKITDNVKPKIFLAEIVPLDKNSSVNGKFTKQELKVFYKNGRYYIPKIIETRGKVGIAVKAHDYMNYVRNTQGIYSAKMYVDDTLYFSYKLDKFSFYETRYINSFIDYAERQLTKRNFQRLWKEPGNKLSIYKTIINSGVLNFDDNKIHKIKIILADCFGNKSYLYLKVRGNKPDINLPENSDMFFYGRDNYFIKPDFRAIIKNGTLYKNTDINFKKYTSSGELYSDIYELNSYLIPAHENIFYAIKPKKLPKKLIGKALLVNIDKNGKFHPLEGTFINGFISGKCKCFGKFAVAVDTTAPYVKLKKVNKENNYENHKKISFIIKDELSGIKNYEVTIDNKLIIFSYDKKSDKISYVFDNHVTYNRFHKLKLTVTDKKNNKSVFNLTFFK